MKIIRVSLICVLALVWRQLSAQTQIDLRTQGKGIDFTSASSTKPFKTGTAAPPTCSIGETFFKTDAPPGQNLFVCAGENVWTQVKSSATVESVGLNMPAEFAVAGSPVTSSGTLIVSKANQSVNTVYAGPPSGAMGAPAFRTLISADMPDLGAQYQTRGERNVASGYAGLTASTQLNVAHGQEVWALVDLSDVSGKQGDGTVVQMASGAPTGGNCAQFDANGNLVDAGAPCGTGTGGGSYEEVFSGQTTVTLAGTEHNFGHAKYGVFCYDNASPKKLIEPDSITIDTSSFDAVVAFASAQSGSCVAVSGSGASGGGGGDVASVFTRTGAVVAVAGDYNAAQITNTPAGNIAATTVQAALNELDTEKSDTAHGHNVAGDVTGTLASSTVAKLQGRTVATAAPTDTQVLAWNAVAAQWEPTTGAGGGGATNATDLYDYKVARTSSSILTINENCSTSKPCNLGWGEVTHTATSSATATISAGTGTAYIYMSNAGTITWGHNGLTVACSAGCTVQSGITSFPADSKPLWTWTANTGAWETTGGTDYRAFLSSKRVTGGIGVSVSNASGHTTVSLDSAAVWMRVAVPATAGSSCTVGQVAQDTGYAYFCVATNTWKRTALSTW